MGFAHRCRYDGAIPGEILPAGRVGVRDASGGIEAAEFAREPPCERAERIQQLVGLLVEQPLGVAVMPTLRCAPRWPWRIVGRGALADGAPVGGVSHRAGGLAVRAKNPGQGLVQHMHPRRVMRTPARRPRLVHGQDRSELIDDLVGGDSLDEVDLEQGEAIGVVAWVQVALLDAFGAEGVGLFVGAVFGCHDGSARSCQP